MRFLNIFLLFWAFQQGFANLVAPEIQPIQSKKTKSGNTIRIICSTENASPLTEFSFYLNGVLLENKKNLKIESSQESYSSLILKPASIDHSGNYTCVAKNKAGTDSFHFQILVHGKFNLK